MAVQYRKRPQRGYHMVPRYTIIKRLEAAGKFADALAALKSDDLLYEKWQSLLEIRSDDAQARALFTQLGLDPDEMLAR